MKTLFEMSEAALTFITMPGGMYCADNENFVINA